MRTFFFTLKCLPLEINIFEDCLAVLIPFIFSHKKYAYVVEKDNTPDRHLHFMLEGPYKDLDAFKRKLRTKPFRAYLELIKRGYISSNQYSIDTQLVPEEYDHKMAILGYLFKEGLANRRSSEGYGEEEIVFAVRSYWSEERLKAMKPSNKHRDVKLISVKNAHAWIRDWLDKQENYDLSNWRVVSYAMRKDYYSFADIPKVKLREIVEDLRLQDDLIGFEEVIITEDIENEQGFYDEEPYMKPASAECNIDDDPLLNKEKPYKNCFDHEGEAWKASQKTSSPKTLDEIKGIFKNNH